MKKVIYTSIFGGYDDLQEPSYIPDGWDFICFTDSKIKSNIWNVITSKPIDNNPAKSSRFRKILAHRFLPEYDISLWVDGNFLIRGNVNKLLPCLDKSNFVTYDHNDPKISDPRNCIYKEASACNRMRKDDSEILERQMEKYKKDNYPHSNGLLSSGIILRKHNELDVKKTMEYWWNEVKSQSKRDQLSFNYSAWKNNFDFLYFQGDIRNNKYFRQRGHKG